MSKPRNVYDLGGQFIIVEEIAERGINEESGEEDCYFSVKAILLPGIIYMSREEVQVKRINNVTSLLRIFEIGDSSEEKYFNEESEWILPVKKARRFSKRLKFNMKDFWFCNSLSFDLHNLFKMK